MKKVLKAFEACSQDNEATDKCKEYHFLQQEVYEARRIQPLHEGTYFSENMPTKTENKPKLPV